MLLYVVIDTICEYLQLLFNFLRAKRADVDLDGRFLCSLGID
jgi:hypothetical protein